MTSNSLVRSLRIAALAVDRKLDKQLASLDITARQLDVLLQLLAEDGLTRAELQERAGIDKGTVDNVMRRLIYKKLVTSKFKEAGASYPLRNYLTPAGRAKAEKGFAIHEVCERAIADKLSGRAPLLTKLNQLADLNGAA